jgi:hypothetical protein
VDSGAAGEVGTVNNGFAFLVVGLSLPPTSKELKGPPYLLRMTSVTCLRALWRLAFVLARYDTVAKQRLEKVQIQGSHPAANRTFALYQQLQEFAEPIPLTRLVLDTGRLSVEECLQQALDRIAAHRPQGQR